MGQEQPGMLQVTLGKDTVPTEEGQGPGGVTAPMSPSTSRGWGIISSPVIRAGQEMLI